MWKGEDGGAFYTRFDALEPAPRGPRSAGILSTTSTLSCCKQTRGWAGTKVPGQKINTTNRRKLFFWTILIKQEYFCVFQKCSQILLGAPGYGITYAGNTLTQPKSWFVCYFCVCVMGRDSWFRVSPHVPDLLSLSYTWFQNIVICIWFPPVNTLPWSGTTIS